MHLRSLLLTAAVLFLGCRNDYDALPDADADSTSYGEDDDSDSSSGSTSSSDETDTESDESGDDTAGDESFPDVPDYDVPPPQAWDPCSSDSDCEDPSPICIVDDYGRGVCSRSCETNLQCPKPLSGTAEAVCTPSKVCLLNCSGALECPNGMACTNTHFNDGFTGGLCLWEEEPMVCAEATQSCTSTNDCCNGLQCTSFKCG